MKKLHIDVETYSDVDLNDAGVYKYVESPNFEIMLCSYSVDGGQVQCVDLASGDKLPQDFLDALTDENIEKHAFNANFERICFSKYLGMKTGKYINPRGWHCDRVLSAMGGFSLSLKDAGEELRIERKKLEEGHDLVMFFSKPCKPTKTRPDEIRHKPEDYPEKWAMYKKYNIRDVEAEMEIETALGFTPVLLNSSAYNREYENYVLDQEINDRGVLIDEELCIAAINADARYSEELYENMKNLTGLANPRSVAQFKPWLDKKLEECGHAPVNDVTKKTIDDLVSDETIPEDLKRILKFKQILGKTSIKKYQRMLGCMCTDGRARGLFQFYGASRTGRFAGRLIQLQNLTKNEEPNILEIRAALKKDGYEGIERYGDVSNILSQLVRSAIIPAPGKVFVDADFAAIEARVLAWLANEQWRLDAFARGEDIYCASASAMFGVPVVKNGENGQLRKKGKVAELACGYGGGVGALKNFGADKMGLTEEEMQKIVTDWRTASPNIEKYWNSVGNAIRDRLDFSTGESPEAKRHANLCTEKRGHAEKIAGAGNCVTAVMLFRTPYYINSGKTLVYNKPDAVNNEIAVQLPSQRLLLYPNSCLEDVEIKTKAGMSFTTKGITYYGVDAKNKWGRLESYGPKFVENITQATARDLLCNSMQNLKKAGYGVCAHIHDEVLVEVPEEKALESLKIVSGIMGRCPDWAQGLLLRADGYLCPCFLKDGFDDKPFLEELEPKQVSGKEIPFDRA